MEMANNVLKHLVDQAQDISEAVKMFQKLEEQTAWSIDIYDSDHNEAVFVFGVVALVFLPLSFFTSYFGMNTVDIRNMDSDQCDFWRIALPISAGVIGLALLVAYFEEHIRDWVSRLLVQQSRQFINGDTGSVESGTTPTVPLSSTFTGTGGIFRPPRPRSLTRDDERVSKFHRMSERQRADEYYRERRMPASQMIRVIEEESEDEEREDEEREDEETEDEEREDEEREDEEKRDEES